MSPPTGKGKESGAARVLGSGASGKFAIGWICNSDWDQFEGVAELLVFHPVDTIAKRLMSNKNKVKFWLEREVNLLTISQVTFSSLSSILFREHASAGLGRKLLSLFPGLGYAAGYKVSQRIYKFGGQPWFNDLLVGRYKTQFTNTFGERRGRMVMQATAGRWEILMSCLLEGCRWRGLPS